MKRSNGCHGQGRSVAKLPGPWFAVLCLCASWLTMIGTPAFAADMALADVRPDPSVVRGVLANGLRYAVRSNAKPSSAMSIRLYIETGSLQETDDERGVAHFLEHMAFEGGVAIKGESLTNRFQQVGISIERDHNAFTNLNGTYYVLDLQEISDAKLDLALTWLRDVTDGLLLDPEAVEKQRGVVTSEYFARRDGGTAVAEVIKRFFEPRLLDPRRSPGGTPESLKAITAQTLRGYYSKWYRPERAFVIIVGDMSTDALKARVENVFGSWKSTTPTPTDPDPGQVDFARKTSFFAVHTPNFAEGVIDICRPSRADPHLGPGVASWKATVADVGWMLPLQQRFDHIARDPAAPILSARVDRSEQDKKFAMTCVSATPKPERWKDALAVLSDEVRRMEDYGVSPVEFDRAMTVITARVDALAATSRTSSQIAQGLIPVLLERDTAYDPNSIKQFLSEARKQATIADTARSFRTRWTDAAEPLLAMVSLVPATPTDLKSAWADTLARAKPQPPAEDAPDKWAYASFGAPGKVVERLSISDPNFVRLTFANGVHANIKTLTSEHDRVEIRVRFGGGQLELKTDDLPVAYIGSSVFVNGGLGRHDQESLSRIMEARAANLRFAMERDHFTLAGSSRAGDAELVAQGLAAFLVDPGFRAESDLRVPQSVKSFYTNYKVTPLLAAQKALRDALPGKPVFPLPPESVAAGYKVSDFSRVLKPLLTKDPIEVTIVGDIREEAATRILSESFGALAPRSGPDRPVTDQAVRLRFPDGPLARITVRHVGLPDKAGVLVVWPMPPWKPERQREIRAITLLRETLSDRVRKVIRERLGQTYTPDVSYAAERGGDDSTMSVAIETNPAAVDQVASEVRAIGRALSQGDVSSEELERIRKPLLDDTAHRRETAGWWLNALDGSYADPYKLAQARTWQADYSSITVKEVNAAAMRWLSRDPIVSIAVPESAAKAVVKDAGISAAPPKNVVN